MAESSRCQNALVLLIGEIKEDPRVFRTCRSLRDAGVSVTAACTSPSGGPPEESWEGISIVRFPHRRESFLKRCYLALQGRIAPRFGRELSRMHEERQSSRLKAVLRNLALSLNFRSFLRETLRVDRMMVERFSGESFDLVHANDADTLNAGSALRRSGAARALLYDAHEFWPGIGSHGSAANVTLRRLEERGIRDADFVTTVNPLIAGMMEREYGLAVTPSVVMNCPYRDDASFSPDAIHAPVRVLYQGKVQAFRGIENLILAFRSLEGAVLTVSGDGPYLEKFRHLARAEHLEEKVRFTGRYEPSETLSIVREHEIGVLPFGTATVSITYSSPNKLFDYMMGGLAILASDLPFLRSVVEGERAGMLLPGNGPEEIAEALRGLIERPGLIASFRRNARSAALVKYCWEEQFTNNYPWLKTCAT
jgi:glycosyltransferase involved in cell wall biosynthesis